MQTPRVGFGSRSSLIAAAGLLGFIALIQPLRVARGADDVPPGGGTDAEPVRLEAVVVSATRIEQRLEDAAASVTVLTREDIDQSAARTVDDLLRQIPGFSLFRRSSSLVAHPTTQGASLRGIGPSGASRALVLLDGIPLADPFGGWVNWSQVSLESIERIEVVRGGGSAVYGSSALGGVIHLVSRRPEARSARAVIDVGTHGTYNADLLLSHATERWGVSAGGSAFRTGGYGIVRPDQRGAIDIDADSEHVVAGGRVEYAPSPDSSLFLSGSFFGEDRGNGTPLQQNATDAGQLSAGGRLRTPGGSDWQLTLFSHLQGFESTFSSPASNRNTETPALDQYDVPSADAGLTLQWSRQLHEEHLLTAGLDHRWIDGETNEDFRWVSGRFTRRRKAGGEQHLTGLYVEDIFTPAPQWQIVAGARIDAWLGSNGFRIEEDAPGVRATGLARRSDAIDDRHELVVSPKLALLYRATDRLTVRSSFYQGFRVPTLNELFRPFRVRNDVTEANDALDPERLFGAEVGLDAFPTDDVSGHVTAFWNEVKDPIANVTLGSGPGLVAPCGFIPAGGVCRQRDNLGRSRIRGIEADLEYRPLPHWSLSPSYLFNANEVVSAPGHPELEGKRIAQVPEHQLTVKLGYTNPALVNAAIQARYLTHQFEDDLNTLALGDLFVVDLVLWRPIPLPRFLPAKATAEIFLAAENLFDATTEVGETADGIVTIGAPRLVHGGFRLRF